MKQLTQDDLMKLLDSLYEKSLKGIEHISPPVEKMANDYLKRHGSAQHAAKSMLSAQIAKCTTSGIITGFGALSLFP